MKVLRMFVWIILLLELLGVAILAYAVSSPQIEKPAYVLLTVLGSILSVAGAALYAKWYKPLKEEKPEYLPGLSPLVSLTDYVIKSSKALATCIKDTKAGLSWMLSNLFVYSLLMYQLRPTTENYYYVASGFGFHLLYLGFIVYLVMKRGETKETLGLRKGEIRSGVPMLLVFMTALTGGAVARLLSQDKPILSSLARPSLYTILLLFFYVVFVPLTEEVFHRGYLQTKFITRLGNSWGLILASLVFSFVHVPKLVLASEFVRSPVGLPLLTALDPRALLISVLSGPLGLFSYFFVVGIMLGWMAREFKSTYYAIAFHAYANFVLAFF